MYEKLRKGKSGGLSEKQYETLLVDFEQNPMDPYDSDSDDVDESLTVPVPPREEDDPVIEYEDEFGRIRTGRRSEIPRHLLPQTDPEQEEDVDPYVIYNPVNHFPVYEPSAERLAAIEAEFSEENNPLNVHYDASREVRAKGAGFYQFSGDEETRRQQMEELKRAREETEKTRENLGAADLRPGEVEGMHAPAEGTGGGAAKSRAMEKRKRELEERRKLLDAKRRKVAGSGSAVSSSQASGSVEEKAKAQAASPDTVASSGAPDPFAVLELQASDKKGKRKQESKPEPVDPADAFLAQLEREMLKGNQGR